MAFPDLPGSRVMYDKDGSQVLYWSTRTNPVTFSGTQLDQLNGHGVTQVYGRAQGGSTTTLCCVFPEPRDFKGVFVAWRAADGDRPMGTLSVYSASDTFSGIDGTWNLLGTMTANDQAAVQPWYRQNISVFNSPGVRGIRLVGNVGGFSFDSGPYLYAFHVYADTLAATVSDRLQAWHPTLDEPLAANGLNWRESPRGSSADLTFRVKNCSATKTANTVVTRLYDVATATTTPAPSSTLLLSTDGTNFAATIATGTMSPGSISPMYTIRRVTPDGYPLGPWQPSVWFDVTNWT